MIHTKTYVGITSLTRLFSFNIYHSKSYFDLNLCKLISLQCTKWQCFFSSGTHINKGPKKDYSIYGHIIFIIGHSDLELGRDTSFSRDTSADQLWLIFKLRVGHEFAKFGHNFSLKGHSDLILKWDTPSTQGVPADKVWWL